MTYVTSLSYSPLWAALVTNEVTCTMSKRELPWNVFIPASKTSEWLCPKPSGIYLFSPTIIFFMHLCKEHPHLGRTKLLKWTLPHCAFIYAWEISPSSVLVFFGETLWERSIGISDLSFKYFARAQDPTGVTNYMFTIGGWGSPTWQGIIYKP
jgi:hypothetical protein